MITLLWPSKSSMKWNGELIFGPTRPWACTAYLLRRRQVYWGIPLAAIQARYDDLTVMDFQNTPVSPEIMGSPARMP